MMDKPAQNAILKWQWLASALLVCCVGLLAQAQSTTPHKRLCASGKIPASYFDLMAHKEMVKFSNLSKKKTPALRPVHPTYQFAKQRMLRSGMVLFNDTVSNYLNQILRIIRSANDVLQKRENAHMRIFVVQSPAVNAFTTRQGFIFVTLGLVAKLKTEDELAFLICHEIAHFLKRHPLLVRKKEAAYVPQLGFCLNEWETVLFERSHYTRLHEIEADSYGFDLFNNTLYNGKVALDYFDALRASKLPTEQLDEFNPSILHNKYFSFAPIDILPLDSLTEVENQHDKFTPHPDIDLRFESAQVRAGGTNDDNGLDNLAQQTALFALPKLFLTQAKHLHALYTNLQLLLKYPKNKYLKNLLGKLLYTLALTRSFYKIHPDPQPQHALFYAQEKNYYTKLPHAAKQIRQLAAFIDSIPAAQLNQLALSTLWTNKYAADDTLAHALRCQGLVHEYLTYYRTTLQGGDPIIEMKVHDRAFAHFVDNYKEQVWEKRKQKVGKVSNKKNKKKLDSKTLLYLAPSCTEVSIRKEKTAKIEASAATHKTYLQCLKENTRLVKLKATFLSTWKMNTKAIKTYNDYGTLQAFVLEHFVSVPGAIASNYQRVQQIAQAYGSTYLVLAGVHSYTPKQLSWRNMLVLGTDTWLKPKLPNALWFVADTRYRSTNYMAVMDLKTGQLIYGASHRTKMKARTAVLNASIYNHLFSFK